MELSIIVTNYGNPELLKLCLDSIKKYVKNIAYELIVSDSESRDDTKMMMREDFPDIRYVPFEKNVGFSATVNAGYKESKGKYILILNGDIIVKENSIEKLLEYIKNEKGKVGLAGPKLLNFNETFQYSCFKFYTPLTILYRRTFLGKFGFAKKHISRFLMEDFAHDKEKEVDWLMGSALITSREAVEKVGPMDDNYRLYFEDVDWCRRFWMNGYKVMYYPYAEMWHYHGRGSAGQNVIKALLSNRLAWFHIISALRYFRKFFGKPVPAHK